MAVLRLYTTPRYLAKLVYMLAGDRVYIDDVPGRPLDGYIALSRRHARGLEGARALYLLEEAVDRGYRPPVYRGQELVEGFVYDPEAFYIVVDILSDFLGERLGLGERVYGSGEALKRLYDHATSKAKKILYGAGGFEALTVPDYFVARAAGLSVERVYVGEGCRVLENLSGHGRCVFTLKQVLGDLFEECRELVRDLVDSGLRLVVVDTSLSCYHLAPVILAVTLRLECGQDI